jgi:multidrug efflux pump subunit AcrA (membrane-fusion protein)
MKNSRTLTLKTAKKPEKKQILTTFKARIHTFIDKRPLVSFFVLLAILLGIIAVGNVLRKPPVEDTDEAREPKKVRIFSIGEAPRMKFTGLVEKSGVVKIVAQTPGIVNYVSVSEGSIVSNGQVLLGLASTYGGGSIPSITRQIAQQTYTLTEQNVPQQLELIQKRREIAEKADAQADQLRDISSQSVQATKDQIALNEQILSALDSQITALESTNVGGVNDALILQAKQGKSGVLSGLAALKTALRNTEYQSSGDEEPAQLSELSKDLTRKQLEIEERSINLSKEIAQLTLRIAQISESIMYPVSPAAGVVERVYVTPGQSVNPGTVLATIAGVKNITTVIVSVPTEIAKEISRLEKSELMIGGKTIELVPRYISTEKTEGSLHSVLFTLPSDMEDLVVHGERIAVEIPVGQAKSTTAVPYVPLDSVFQTQDMSIVYVASRSSETAFTVVPKTVELGDVFGSFVQIRNGINAADQVIVDRNILAGDNIQF